MFRAKKSFFIDKPILADYINDNKNKERERSFKSYTSRELNLNYNLYQVQLCKTLTDCPEVFGYLVSSVFSRESWSPSPTSEEQSSANGLLTGRTAEARVDLMRSHVLRLLFEKEII